MKRPVTPDSERRQLEALGAGIGGMRQAAAAYLASHGIRQDVAWQIGQGRVVTMVDEDGETWTVDAMARIFAALDDARYVIEATSQPQTPPGVAALQGIAVDVGGLLYVDGITLDASDPEADAELEQHLEPAYKCPSCGQEIRGSGPGLEDEMLSDHHGECPVLERQLEAGEEL